MTTLHETKSRLLEEVLAAHQQIATSAGNLGIIPRILSRVGAAARVDRVYIFQLRSDRAGTIVASQRFEWSASSVEPQIDNPNLQDIPLRDAGYGRWLDRLLAYRPVFGAIRHFPHAERRLLAEQDIQSLLVLPIYTDALLWGFVGFDDCSTERVWSSADVDALLSLAISLGPVFLPSQIDHENGSLLERPTTNTRIAGYAAIAGGLLWPADDRTGTEQSIISTRVVEARIRSLVRTHQFLRTRTGDERVSVGDYLLALQDHFHLITRDRHLTTTVVESSGARPVMLWAETIPAIGMLVTERLLTIDPDGSLDRDHMTVSVESDGEHARVMIRGWDVTSRSVLVDYEPDASSLLFVRRLLSQIGGTSATPPDGDGTISVTLPPAGRSPVGEQGDHAVS